MNNFVLIRGLKNGDFETAMKNIENGYNHIVGGYYNEMLDSPDEPRIPPEEDIKAEIAKNVMEFNYLSEGCEIGSSVEEMKYVDRAFVRDYIEYLWRRDDDAKEIIAARKPKYKYYPVRVEESLGKTVLVKAEDWCKAEKIAERAYKANKIVLNSDNFVDSEVDVLEDFKDGFDFKEDAMKYAIDNFEIYE